MENFDCVVIGGGMVGAASALSLANLGLRVAVVEQFKPKEFTKEQPLDLRVSAISLVSQHLLSQLNSWKQVKQWRSCEYKRLGVWELPHAYTEFNAKDIAQDHLGDIVENRLLQLALWQELNDHHSISLYCPERLVDIKQSAKEVIVTLSESTLSTKLVVGADGANSKVRQLSGIGITGWDYQQSAMLINVETELAQQDITWQQFTPSGPVAFLPLPGKSELGGYASLVWYHNKAEIKRLASLANTQLTTEIHQYFPKRLGTVKVIDKASFPLTRRHANNYQQGRVLLLGDAAHTINPLAGQGVNLGFKDVKALQNVIATAIANGESWHAKNVLVRYEKARRHDNLLMMSVMDALYASFSHPSSLVKMARNLSFMAINKLPLINTHIKNKALAYACGVTLSS